MVASGQVKASERTVEWTWEPNQYPDLVGIPTQSDFRDAIDEIHRGYGKDPHRLMATYEADFLTKEVLSFAKQTGENRSPEKSAYFSGSASQWATFCSSARTSFRLQSEGALERRSKTRNGADIWKRVSHLEGLYNTLTGAHTNGGQGTHLARDKMVNYLKKNGLFDGIKLPLITKYLSLCPSKVCCERREAKHRADARAEANKAAKGEPEKKSLGKRRMESEEEDVEAQESKRQRADIVQEEGGQDRWLDPIPNQLPNPNIHMDWEEWNDPSNQWKPSPWRPEGNGSGSQMGVTAPQAAGPPMPGMNDGMLQGGNTRGFPHRQVLGAQEDRGEGPSVLASQAPDPDDIAEYFDFDRYAQNAGSYTEFLESAGWSDPVDENEEKTQGS